MRIVVTLCVVLALRAARCQSDAGRWPFPDSSHDEDLKHTVK